MTFDEVAAALRTFIRTEFKISADDRDFNDDVHIFDYGYVDSFGAVQILNFVKSRFGVTISDQDLTLYPLNTVNEIAGLVHGRLEGKP